MSIPLRPECVSRASWGGVSVTREACRFPTFVALGGGHAAAVQKAEVAS